MKTLLKRFIPCLLIVLSIFAIVSCKDGNKYEYPNPSPLYTNEGTFVQVGDLKVTNKDIYNRLIQSYGIEEIKNVIDAQLLKDVVLTEEQERDFQDQLLESKYGTTDVDSLTEEEKKDALKAFELTLLSNGLHYTAQGENDPLYYENYYRLDYKRYVKTLEVLTSEIKEHDNNLEEDEEPYFTDTDYLSYFTGNFHKTYKLIIVTFDSEKEAKEAMAAAGINLNTIIGKWESNNGVEMTDEEIQAAFKAMYKQAYNKECEGAVEYTYKDLLNLKSSSSTDGVIASKAVSLEAGEYTHGPLSFTNRYFMIYSESVGTEYVYDADETVKYADSDANIAEKDEKGNIVELTAALKEKLFAELVKLELGTSANAYQNNIDRVMFELRQAAGLEIFAEGVEVAYKQSYDSVFSTLDITDYEAFKATPNTSATEVVKWNGGSITVDQMFNALTTRYGALITLLFVQQYTILTSEHNTIVNYVTGEVLNSERYEELTEEDIDAYKESFEDGDFESYGFPAEYGWTNFLRDYLGLTEEAAIIVDFNSTLYEEVLALYTKALYMAKVGDVEVVVQTDAEGNKTYALKSSKWTKEHNTGVEVVEGEVPTLTIAWSEADITGLPKVDGSDKAIVYAKNDYYGHFILTFKDGKQVLTKITADQAVSEVYDEIYNETFSATASGLYVYFDKDFDGVADEVEESEATLAKELVEAIWKAAKEANADDSSKTLVENLTKIVREYKLAGASSAWYAYKQAGLRISIISGATYSNSTNADEAILNEVKVMWQAIVDYKNSQGISQTITGQNLDPVYRYIYKDNVETVGIYDFADLSKAVYADNGYYQLAVTKATAKTAYQYSTSTKTQKPSLYLYEQYQLDSKDREVTINCSSQMTTYYVPAVSRLTSEDVVNKAIMTDCKALLSKVTFTNNHEATLAILTQIIEEALVEVE
jgi:hypothetical protein